MSTEYKAPHLSSVFHKLSALCIKLRSQVDEEEVEITLGYVAGRLTTDNWQSSGETVGIWLLLANNSGEMKEVYLVVANNIKHIVWMSRTRIGPAAWNCP